MVLIEQVEINDSLKKDIQKEFEKYEAKDGVSFNHTPFCFVAKENGKVIGAITGFRCFSEIYIDELIVFEHQRGKHRWWKIPIKIKICIISIFVPMNFRHQNFIKN